MARRVLMLVISLLYEGACRSRELIAALFGRRNPAPTVVLTYHGFARSDVARFERQMELLKRTATPVFADEAHSNGRQSVSVTFDDAFQSVFEHALPVLTRHDIPATVFVPTGYIGREPGWIENRRADRGTDRVAAAETLTSEYPVRVRLGSHTVTHPRLDRLDSVMLRRELTESKAALETLTAGPVRMLALPFGACSQAVVAMASQVGYERVFANVPVTDGACDRARLVGRVNVTPDDWPLEFYLKLRGAYGWMALGVPAKRRILKVLRKV
jgi:peptidoglycan/xylan/chitin deacetylase (PgdA/CDA1 family)